MSQKDLKYKHLTILSLLSSLQEVGERGQGRQTYPSLRLCWSSSSDDLLPSPIHITLTVYTLHMLSVEDGWRLHIPSELGKHTFLNNWYYIFITYK
jgi:hypothetical protein